MERELNFLYEQLYEQDNRLSEEDYDSEEEAENFTILQEPKTAPEYAIPMDDDDFPTYLSQLSSFLLKFVPFRGTRKVSEPEVFGSVFYQRKNMQLISIPIFVLCRLMQGRSYFIPLLLLPYVHTGDPEGITRLLRPYLWTQHDLVAIKGIYICVLAMLAQYLGEASDAIGLLFIAYILPPPALDMIFRIPPYEGHWKYILLLFGAIWIEMVVVTNGFERQANIAGRVFGLLHIWEMSGMWTTSWLWLKKRLRQREVLARERQASQTSRRSSGKSVQELRRDDDEFDGDGELFPEFDENGLIPADFEIYDSDPIVVTRTTSRTISEPYRRKSSASSQPQRKASGSSQHQRRVSSITHIQRRQSTTAQRNRSLLAVIANTSTTILWYTMYAVEIYMTIILFIFLSDCIQWTLCWLLDVPSNLILFEFSTQTLQHPFPFLSIRQDRYEWVKYGVEWIVHAAMDIVWMATRIPARLLGLIEREDLHPPFMASWDILKEPTVGKWGLWTGGLEAGEFLASYRERLVREGATTTVVQTATTYVAS